MPEEQFSMAADKTQLVKKGSHKSVIQFAAQLAGRDGGWFCHYCNAPLVPPGTAHDAAPYYKLVMIKTCHPMTTGDCNGLYTREQVYEACRLAMNGQLHHWRLRWQLAEGYRYVQVDHMVPRSKGGADHLDNLVLACTQCNQQKKARSYEEFVNLKRDQPGSSHEH